ncbi:MAG: arsC [Schlesneria sp.]|nr:arsC [Schlesneria sp.]
MKTFSVCGGLWMCLGATLCATEPASPPVPRFPAVQKYLEERAGEFDQISDERKVALQKLADYVSSRAQAGKPARFTFICTHNSRRSHLSQIWAAAAADFYNVPGVESFSGGTEATAFNPRAIAAVERAGMKVEKTEEGKNPQYAVQFREPQTPLICFSKVYKDAPNPNADFCAVMTCSQADKNCPIVAGCSLRVAIPFEDPKVSDDTPEERATYDARCQQICREMLYVFSHAKE